MTQKTCCASYRLLSLQMQDEILAQPEPLKASGFQQGCDFTHRLFPTKELRLIELTITSHVMTSSERLPPPPLMFVGATTGTGEQETSVPAATPCCCQGPRPLQD